jgi:hypothetical protein
MALRGVLVALAPIVGTVAFRLRSTDILSESLQSLDLNQQDLCLCAMCQRSQVGGNSQTGITPIPHWEISFR